MSYLSRESVNKFKARAHEVSVAVLGDTMLDRYVMGDVDRISPEAPVPVLRVNKEFERVGGAGNVVRNLAAMMASVECFPCVGEDEYSQRVLALYQERGIRSHVIKDKALPAIVKTRVVARKQQIVRIDRDPPSGFSFPAHVHDQLMLELKNVFQKTKVLVVSDYGKGLLTDSFLEKVLHEARDQGVATYVDPKNPDYMLYRGCTAITPNTKEAFEATGVRVTDDATAAVAARRIYDLTFAPFVFITRADQGITVYDGQRRQAYHLPAQPIEVFDVTGAGDTVIATLALSHALGVPAYEAAMCANIAASVVVAQVGAVACKLEQFIDKATGFIDSPENVSRS